MRILLTFGLLLLLFISCKNEESINIEGKWNLKVYQDSLGNERNITYSIFIWYESGFEFVSEDAFYPRYGPPNDKWFTGYDAGPGNYRIANNELILSYKDTQFTYDLTVKDNELVLENFKSDRAWIGKWTLIKE